MDLWAHNRAAGQGFCPQQLTADAVQHPQLVVVTGQVDPLFINYRAEACYRILPLQANFTIKAVDDENPTFESGDDDRAGWAGYRTVDQLLPQRALPMQHTCCSLDRPDGAILSAGDQQTADNSWRVDPALTDLLLPDQVAAPERECVEGAVDAGGIARSPEIVGEKRRLPGPKRQRTPPVIELREKSPSLLPTRSIPGACVGSSVCRLARLDQRIFSVSGSYALIPW